MRSEVNIHLHMCGVLLCQYGYHFVDFQAILPHFKRGSDGTVFTSAAKQGLAMFRMRRLANVCESTSLSLTEHTQPHMKY